MYLPNEMTIQQYINQINQLFNLNKSTEHTFRGDLHKLIETLIIEIRATNNHLSTEKSLNLEIVKKIEKDLDLVFVPENETYSNVCFANNAEVRDDYKNTFSLIDVLDYSYAILHSSIYREKYKAFLKIDFSQVAYPKNTATFWQLVKLGGEIRQMHLIESNKTKKYTSKHPRDAGNT